MIGRLHGRLVHKQPPHLIMDVHGVGYEIEAPMSTFYVLPPVGSDFTLHTHLAVREDAQQLFGFATLEERQLFRDLIKVSGIGGKLALTILSGISARDFAVTVQSGDSDKLTQLPGIGKKTAARLIVEMRDRLGTNVDLLPETESMTPKDRDATSDAFSALLALGYRDAEAHRLLKRVNKSGVSSEELIRLALQSALK